MDMQRDPDRFDLRNMVRGYLERAPGDTHAELSFGLRRV
jgi:hypothetical protein